MSSARRFIGGELRQKTLHSLGRLVNLAFELVYELSGADVSCHRASLACPQRQQSRIAALGSRFAHLGGQRVLPGKTERLCAGCFALPHEPVANTSSPAARKRARQTGAIFRRVQYGILVAAWRTRFPRG